MEYARRICGLLHILSYCDKLHSFTYPSVDGSGIRGVSMCTVFEGKASSCYRVHSVIQ